jgi:uncharacterized protein
MPISPRDGGYKGYHNYYVPDEFFRREDGEGALYLRDGQRAAHVGEDFVAGLHSGLEEEVGGAGGYIMYRCGFEWALQDMKRFNHRMRHEFGGGKLDVWQMNPRFVFETWWWPLNVTGWGAWTLELDFDDRGITLVEIRNSAVAQSMQRVGKPVCHMYAGLFAGAMTYFLRDEREGIEVQCYAMGNDVCKFLIGEGRTVNAASFWRQEGATANEILDHLG